MTAYFKLRKGWLLAFYALIILAGMVGMVVDSGNWHHWEKQFDQHFSATEYGEIRDYLGTELDSHADVYDKFERANVYLNMIGFDGDSDGNGLVKQAGAAPSAFYRKMPAKFEAFRERQLSYYVQRDSRRHHDGFATSNYIWVGNYPDDSIYLSLNAVALMGTPLLVILAVYGLMLILDQWKQLPALMRSRTGHAGLLLGTQAVYWALIPVALASVLSILTQLTRTLFIPAKYVTVPWSMLLTYSAGLLSQVLILAILISFVHALVGHPIYKVITFICALGAVILAIDVIYGLTGLGILNRFGHWDTLLLAALLIPATVWLQAKYSLEQDRAYIRLPKLRLAFYLVIVCFTILDFLVPLLALRGKSWNMMDTVIKTLVPLVIIVLFAKLVLNKDVRDILK